MPTDFKQIRFNPAYHTYTYQGHRLQNVTSLINEVTEPFDKEAVAQKQADKQGVPVEFILAEWEDKRKASIERGIKVHRHIEYVLSGGDPLDPVLALNAMPEVEAFNKFWERASESMNPDKVEWVIGDGELKIAGTVDAVMLHQNGQYFLFDWKTGKLDTSNPYEKMLGRFAHLDDCKLNRYSLQAGVYRLIIERNTGLDIGGAYIVHLGENGDYYIHKAVDLAGMIGQWLQERIAVAELKPR